MKVMQSIDETWIIRVCNSTSVHFFPAPRLGKLGNNAQGRMKVAFLMFVFST